MGSARELRAAADGSWFSGTTGTLLLNCIMVGALCFTMYAAVRQHSKLTMYVRLLHPVC